MISTEKNAKSEPKVFNISVLVTYCCYCSLLKYTVHVDNASKRLLFATNTKDKKLSLSTQDITINEIER
jgi:hypothetical protein